MKLVLPIFALVGTVLCTARYYKGQPTWSGRLFASVPQRGGTCWHPSGCVTSARACSRWCRRRGVSHQRRGGCEDGRVVCCCKIK
ncbi:hypothetical protein L249_4545 [Ophiocordyceps polyrhachis-furcata BCC 54312]|uniref:Uncharacterized protein n=1 Tax=Ophiocordyceps polyrhachis-furcata BCC 54312 TaxID=1330021 RepID=A0A367KZ53_9HYPO|nr:hypothetical protein L249_4545 [Ophiocordyceps polyrhachis-furcata BCC 54312]